MDTPSSRLLLLLQRLAQHTREIRRDLPGWSPHKLIPALEATLVRIAAPGATCNDLDIAAARLAEVLQERPETENIARALETGPQLGRREVLPAPGGATPVDAADVLVHQ